VEDCEEEFGNDPSSSTAGFIFLWEETPSRETSAPPPGRVRWKSVAFSFAENFASSWRMTGAGSAPAGAPAGLTAVGIGADAFDQPACWGAETGGFAEIKGVNLLSDADGSLVAGKDCTGGICGILDAPVGPNIIAGTLPAASSFGTGAYAFSMSPFSGEKIFEKADFETVSAVCDGTPSTCNSLLISSGWRNPSKTHPTKSDNLWERALLK